MKNLFNLQFPQGCAGKMTLAAFFILTFVSAHRLSALTVTVVTSDNGYPAHEVQWTDSAGLPRTAILVDQRMTPAPYTGYLRRYTYQVNGQTRTCTGTQNYATGGNLEFSGDGFVQNHTAASNAYPDGGDFSSGNGSGVPGTTTITLQGTDHAIITYSMPNYPIANQAGQTQIVPTTVQWFFADGRSHPIFSITQDARATTGNIAGDSRTPYGDMAYDGDGTGAYVGGCSYGDTYKFVTLAASPEEVTEASGWSDTQANTIPYAMQWANPATVDAEMGHVATLPISISDQGEDPQDYPVIDPRGTSKPNGPMLTDASWAFQILNESFPPSGPTMTKRLTWGACYGRVGGWDDSSPDYTDPRYPDNVSTSLTQYNRHADDPLGDTESGTRANGLLMAYSTFVVLGTHTGGYTNGTVGQTVIQMQNVTHATLAATIGTVAATGPAGVAAATNATITYSPAGFNPTYAAWEIAAKTNAVNATLTAPTNYPLDHPIFVINSYTSTQLPASVAVGTGLTNAGVNYFASVDTNGQRLWITVNRVVTNALNLVVSPVTGGSVQPAPVITAFSPVSGLVGTSVVITGQSLTNATAVTFGGVIATTFAANSSTQITATVPTGAATGPISVTTAGGIFQTTTNFTVTVAAPIVSSFNPTNGGVGTSVVITGSSFSGATTVSFNGVASTFAVNSATQITATVPGTATTGTIAVTTPGGTGHSTATFTVVASTNLVIYLDSLLNGFQDYSWATVNFASTSPVYAGSDSISVSAPQYSALWPYHDPFNTVPYGSLSFWLYTGLAGSAGLEVEGVTNNAAAGTYTLPAIVANTWTQFNIPLAALGVGAITNCEGFWFYATGAGTTAFHVDSVQLNTPSAPTLAVIPGQTGSVILQLGGYSGQSYWLQTSTNLTSWSSVSTNSLVSAAVNITNAISTGKSQLFWRAVLP